MMKLCAIIATVASLMAGVTYGVSPNDFKCTQFGDVPANASICTNVDEAIGGVISELNDKQGKFILGRNLQRGSTVYKLTLGSTDSIGGEDKFPYPTPIYASGTNFFDQVKIYDVNTIEIPSIDTMTNFVGAVLDRVDNDLVVRFRYNDQEVYVPVTGVEIADKLVVDVVLDSTGAVGYSHPYDWRLTWRALEEEWGGGTTYDTETATNRAGKVTEKRTVTSLKLSKIGLGIDYMDEINLPQSKTYEYNVVDGAATIDKDVLTASASGVVKVRATNDLGESRDADVSCYRFMSSRSYSRYNADQNINRKRVNDWHLGLLQQYRSNPTTNRVYGTWNSPEYNRHIGWNGDTFNGVYGKHFFPWQHMTSPSGSTGFWSSHGVISKHVLLAANHYGDWNHSRAKGMTVYVNWDNKFSGKTAVKLVQYYNLNTWAQNNGFEGADASLGDLGVYVCRTLDDENVGIPDECLPYIATPDWLNATYGYEWEGDNAGVCIVNLNQAATIGLRMNAGSPTWSSVRWVGSEGLMNYASDTDDPWLEQWCRADIGLYARRCGFHGPILGDSGQPLFLYDPAYTVPGKTYDFGNGPEPLIRPMILWCHTSVSGGTSVGQHIKVLKAFCESIGDTLDYILGDPNQSADYDVIVENAKAANGGSSN